MLGGLGCFFFQIKFVNRCLFAYNFLYKVYDLVIFLKNRLFPAIILSPRPTELQSGKNAGG